MTDPFNPRLFIENGPAVLAEAIHRRHRALRFRYAGTASRPGPPANAAKLGAAACGTIRFAL